MVDGKGKVPLHYSVQTGFYEGFALLIQRCESPLALIDREGNTLLHLAVMYPNSVEVLLDILKIKGGSSLATVKVPRALVLTMLALQTST